MKAHIRDEEEEKELCFTGMVGDEAFEVDLFDTPKNNFYTSGDSPAVYDRTIHHLEGSDEELWYIDDVEVEEGKGETRKLFDHNKRSVQNFGEMCY